MTRWPAGGLVFAFGWLWLIAPAAADRQPEALDVNDQAVAHLTVVARTDLGAGAKWTGGVVKAPIPVPTLCPAFAFAPLDSDLVASGAAAADWKSPGFRFDSYAQVMQTAAMAKTGWQRWAKPSLLQCLKSANTDQSTGTFAVSAAHLPFPRVGSFTAAYRTIVDDGTGNRVLEDLVLVARERTRFSLLTFAGLGPADGPPAGIASAKKSVTNAEVRLVRAMAARAALSGASPPRLVSKTIPGYGITLDVPSAWRGSKPAPSAASFGVVYLYRATEAISGFHANLNVIVAPLPKGDTLRQWFFSGAGAAYQFAGTTTSVTIGGVTGLHYVSTKAIKAGSQALLTEEYALVKDGHVIVFTYTSLASTKGFYQRIFGASAHAIGLTDHPIPGVTA